MDPIIIVVIVVVSLAVVCGAVVLALRLHKKPQKQTFTGKTDKDILVQSNEQISRNTKTVDLIAVSAREEEKSRLEELKEKLRYLSPSLKSEVHEIDARIKEVLDGYRSKAEAGKELGDFKEIERLLAERKLYTV